MPLAPEELPVTTWTITTADLLLERILTRATSGDQARPLIVGIDGRSGGGKTTLCEALREAGQDRLGAAAVDVLHVDDLAWNEPMFGWAYLVRAVLEPLRRGETVSLVPPAWPQHQREGAIEIPAGLSLLLVEGVGTLQRETHDLFDVGLWIQSDLLVAETRGIARDVESGVNGDLAEAIAFWHEWDSHERPFQERERPWERADVIVWGTPDPALAAGEFAVSSAHAF